MYGDRSGEDRVDAILGKCAHDRCKRVAQNLSELVCEVTEDYHFAYVSPAFEKALAYTSEDLVGRKVKDFVHPDDFERLPGVLRQDIAPYQPYSGTGLRVRGRDGRWRIFDWTAERFVSEQGDTRIVSCCHEVTESWEANERLRDLAACLPDALVMVDSEGRIQLFNEPAEQIFGYREEEVFGRPLELLIPHAARSSHSTDRARFFRDRQNRRMGSGSNQTALRKDGFEVPVEINLSRVGSDVKPYVVAVVRDVSGRIRRERQRAKLEAQLRHSQKLEGLGRLASGVAHDLKNMLGSIVNLSNLALSQLEPGSAPSDTIERTKEVAGTMARLCSQLLEYAGRAGGELHLVDLSTEVDRLRPLLAASVGAEAQLEIDVGSRIPPVRADPSQLAQILLNLVINASESLQGREGTVEISTGMLRVDEGLRSELYLADSLVGDHYVYLSVSDTGCGIDEETKERLFDPFFSTKEREGRGLGMAVVLGIVRRHGAAIRVSSSREGGTLVTVLFEPGEDPEASR